MYVYIHIHTNVCISQASNRFVHRKDVLTKKNLKSQSASVHII